ncbi:MAG: hypothetical protein ACE5JV_00770 [Nitrososphaerales archaeon]
MVTETFKVSGRSYSIVLNEQTTMLVSRLRRLYSASYGDVESFDQVSSAISNTINELRNVINPEPREEDLDGIIQEIFKLFERKAK